MIDVGIGTTTHSSNVAEMRLTATVAEARIRKLAQDSENVIVGNHGREQMLKREISDGDVFRVLRNGHIEGEPRRTERNEWQCKMILQIKGIRSVGVVTIILHSGKLFVKTVEWEDMP